jgi:hypothetical protein
MKMNEVFALDRSLNGNHTPACALPTRGGICDCWPLPTGSPPSGQLGQPGGKGSTEDQIRGLGSELLA